ncbi:MAG: iron-containing alcohol dehydrogenase [Dermatophilaceae bacterium]
MWAPRVDPINQASALEGIRVLRQGLADVARRPQDIEAREQTLYGAYLAASAFTSADPGLHHKICHVLGGLDNLPHAQTHALVLPHVLAFDAPSIPDGDQRMAAAFDAPPSLLPLHRKVRRCRQTRLITAASDHSRPRADDPRRCPQRRREVILWMDSFATAHR